ncbi:MAG: helix-turn-helix domain-containing protein [Sarcina sp.]
MEKLVNFRHSLGFTQRQMSNNLDITESFYFKIENGERKPSYNFLKKFKKTFPKANIDFLFFEE